jgi:hypothetical protein
MTVTTPQQLIINACEAEFQNHIADCSGFAKAVASELSITLTGMANDIVDQIQTAPWTLLPDGIAAKAQADAGNFVIGGLKDDPHGHVVVVVQGPIDSTHGKYPTAYWGSIRGAQFAAKDKTVNWAWDVADRDNVIYACVPLSS